MISRRHAIGAALLSPYSLVGAPARVAKQHFAVHPFVEKNPKAVFIKKTRVPHKMDEAAKLREGIAFAREVFVPADSGIPISHRIVLKPNFTSVRNERKH